MATKNIVPRADGEGSIGTSAKKWGNVYADNITVTTGLTASTFTGDLTGDVTGNVTGDVTGNVTGNLVGDVTGDVTGDLTGDVTGNVTGNVTGDLTGTASKATADENGNNIASTYLPAVVGAVVAFAGSTSPAGWLLCDGSAVSRTDYAALFAVIGTTYGTGDGSTTFNLPNLTDKFIQGSATSGTVKAAGLPNIEGTADFREQAGSASVLVANSGAFGRTNVNRAGYSSNAAGATSTRASELSINAANSNSIYGNSTTVQPPALTMRYIIKT